MASLFDTIPYPFHTALGQKLHLALCRLYPTSQTASFAGEKAGVPAYKIDDGNSADLVWRAVLRECAAEGLLRSLVQLAIREKAQSPERTTLEALLAGRGATNWPSGTEIDRDPQWRKLRNEFPLQRKKRPGAVQVYLLPCMEPDQPAEFVRRAIAHFEQSGATRDPAQIHWREYGSLAEIQDEFKRNLFDKLTVPDDDYPEREATALESHLSEYKYVFIESFVKTKWFGGEVERFLTWLASEYWPGFSLDGCQVFHFAHIQHEEQPPSERCRDLEKALAQTHCPVTVLDVLGEVSNVDLQKWLHPYEDIDSAAAIDTIAAKAQELGGRRMKHILGSVDQWRTLVK